MKHIFKKSFFPVVALMALLLHSCYDEKMDWHYPDGRTPISMTEIPLTMAEKLSRYEPLKNYAQFSVGLGVDLTLYLENPDYKNLVDENFDVVTVGYHMKHAAMVSGTGELNFTAVDNFFNNLPAGMTVFGHTLVWHQNQNASYLNGLIAPDVVPDPAGSNLAQNGDFETGTLSGWSVQNPGKGITVTSDVKLAGTYSAKMISNTGSTNAWDLQMKSANISTVSGHAYQISFWVKSEGSGKGRLSFSGMSNGYPWINGSEWFTTSNSWTQITYGSDKSLTATGTTLNVSFDMGYVGDMTYYVDNIVVLDLDASDGNVFDKGDFEAGNFDGWNRNNIGAGITITQDMKYEGSYAAKLISSATSSNAWDLQLTSPEIAVVSGHSYELSFWIKSEGDGKGRVSFTGISNGYPWLNGSEWFTTTSTWTQVVYGSSIVQPTSAILKLSFDLGYVANITYYLDDIKLIDKTTGLSSPVKAKRSPAVYIEKTAEEKAIIIDNALKTWIHGMVGHYKDKVTAWDVINEPMAENGTIRTSDGNNASDAFYWQDYLGKDFAVKAFQYAREAGNANDILFINDYNLESSTEKLDGFIEYIEYIESKGVVIDGIGTQMHLSIASDTTKFDAMFKKVANTGKKIKISELDVKVNTSSPSAEQFELQAEIYRKVVESYIENVPEAQRYGITVWSLTDADSWIKDDAPCLWKGDYSRKIAYKGFADGLAGKDVSEDFTGELQ